MLESVQVVGQSRGRAGVHEARAPPARAYSTDLPAGAPAVEFDIEESNCFCFIGNFGLDPQVTTLASGALVANFSVAMTMGRDKRPLWCAARQSLQLHCAVQCVCLCQAAGARSLRASGARSCGACNVSLRPPRPPCTLRDLMRCSCRVGCIAKC